MKMKIAFMATGILLLLLWSCKKDKTDPVNNSSNFAATMSGASENPANSSVATGSATGTYDSVSKVLTLTISYSGITPTAGHIHKGAVGSNGPVTFPFSSVSIFRKSTCPVGLPTGLPPETEFTTVSTSFLSTKKLLLTP